MRLGDLVAQALDGALKALARRDLVLADRVVRDALEVNRLRYQLEEELVGGMAAAGGVDIRSLVGALYVLLELERMLDQADGLAKAASLLGSQTRLLIAAAV